MLCVCNDTLRAGLATLLDETHRITVVHSVSGGPQLLADSVKYNIHVAVLDTTPDLDVQRVTRLLESGLRAFRGVVVLVRDDDADLVADLLTAGVRGVALREGPIDDLAQAIRVVDDGHAFVAPPLMSRLLDYISPIPIQVDRQAAGNIVVEALTPREREVLQLMASGQSNKDIAANLVIEVRTVKYHVSNILTKLGVRDRGQAMALAHRTGQVVTARTSDRGRN